VGGEQLPVERFQGNLPYSSCFRRTENSEDAMAGPNNVMELTMLIEDVIDDRVLAP
jgi:hypothetical protein